MSINDQIKYDRRIYLLQAWEADLDRVMRQSKIKPPTIDSMTSILPTDSLRDLMEFAIKGVKAELEGENK